MAPCITRFTSKTTALGRSPAPDGHGVNPGATMTTRLTKLIRDGIGGHDNISTGPYKAADPDEVADTVVYLASARASHVSGTVLTVDNGRTKR